jgi:hypothetical protein
MLTENRVDLANECISDFEGTLRNRYAVLGQVRQLDREKVQWADLEVIREIASSRLVVDTSAGRGPARVSEERFSEVAICSLGTGGAVGWGRNWIAHGGCCEKEAATEGNVWSVAD